MRYIADNRRVNAHPHQLGCCIYSVVSALFYIFEQLVNTHPRRVELLHMQVILALFERAYRLEQALLEAASDAHDLARRLHLGRKRVVRGGELVKREARHLGHDIVERGLEAGRGIGKLYLMQVHAYCYLRRDARYRISARL